MTMKKVLLDYDDSSNLYQNGMLVTNFVGLEEYTEPETASFTPVDDIVKLKEAGFDADEIIEMKKRDVIA